MRHGPIYHDCCTFQKKIKAKLEEPLDSSDISALVRAWDLLEDRKRIIKGRGVPKPEEPAKPKRKVPVAGMFRE
jgi:hypothetical protein